MKENLSKNKVWQIIGIAVLCAVCVLTTVLGVVFGMNHSSEDLNVSKDMSNQDNIVVETVQEQGIKLTSGVATTAADGMTTKTLTATVTPSGASRLGYTWSVAFKNSTSPWANGKKASDYVSITQDSANKLKAVLSYKKKFNEQIIVSVVCDVKPDVKATATVDCYKELADFSMTFSAQGVQDVYCEGLDLDYQANTVENFFTLKDYGGSYNCTFGDGTIEGNIAGVITYGASGEEQTNLKEIRFQENDEHGIQMAQGIRISISYNGIKVAEYEVEFVYYPSSISLNAPSFIF